MNEIISRFLWDAAKFCMSISISDRFADSEAWIDAYLILQRLAKDFDPIMFEDSLLDKTS